MSDYKLVIDDEVLELPDELTIGQYQQLTKYPERYKDNIQVLSLLTGLTVHELKNLTKEQIQLIDTVVGSKFKVENSDTVIFTFEHDGVEYGLENDWSKMAWGAWVDIEVYSSENVDDNIHKIMSVLYRPVIKPAGKKLNSYVIQPYKSEEIEARSEIMKDVPVRIWFGLSSFFLLIGHTYINSIKNSLNTEMTWRKYYLMGKKKLPQFLQKRLSDDFTFRSPTNWLKKIRQKLKR